MPTNGPRASGRPRVYAVPDWGRVDEMRRQGWTWAKIATAVGNTGDNLKQLHHLRTHPESVERQRARSRATARRGSRKRRARIDDLLTAAKDRPCVDCGIRLPTQCMDLDHVQGVKEFNLAWSKGGKCYATFEQIAAEIAKCEVRCPNCHRLRHYRLRYADPASRQTKLAL